MQINKYIKLVENLPIDSKIKNDLHNAITKPHYRTIDNVFTSRGVNDNGGTSGRSLSHQTTQSRESIIKAGMKHLRICGKLLKEDKIVEIEAIINMVYQVISSWGLFQQGLMEKSLKIRAILLKAELILYKAKKHAETQKKDKNLEVSQKEIDFIRRLPIFCRQIEKEQVHIQFFQSDFYSFIEILYFNAASSFVSTFHEKNRNFSKQNEYLTNIFDNKVQICGLIDKGRICLTKQLQKLCVILKQMEDRKVFDIIQRKCQALLQFYGLQLAILFTLEVYESKNEQICSQYCVKDQCTCQNVPQLNENIYFCSKFRLLKAKIKGKYEKILNQVPNCIDLKKIQDIVNLTFVHYTEKIPLKEKQKLRLIPMSIFRTKNLLSKISSKASQQVSVKQDIKMPDQHKQNQQQVIEDKPKQQKKVIIRTKKRSHSVFSQTKQVFQDKRDQSLKNFRSIRVASCFNFRISDIKLTDITNSQKGKKQNLNPSIIVPGLMKKHPIPMIKPLQI